MKQSTGVIKPNANIFLNVGLYAVEKWGGKLNQNITSSDNYEEKYTKLVNIILRTHRAQTMLKSNGNWNNLHVFGDPTKSSLFGSNFFEKASIIVGIKCL